MNKLAEYRNNDASIKMWKDHIKVLEKYENIVDLSKELKKAYSEYWDYIGCVQIPHHGSYKNYNKEFALFDAYFIISSGLNNRYRHPSGSVIKNLLLNNKYPQIVTEQQSSEAILKIDI